MTDSPGEVLAVARDDGHRFSKPAVVVASGVVRPGDGIRVILPQGRHEPLRAV